ncbi:MAG: DUF2807 domain-containing protein [Muribaculaceae bacterium]|nr:DUF2807 domain-containing protein [Muribaculaceae bacterium]
MNISTLTTGLVLSTSLLLSGCSVNGIANSHVSLDGNEEAATVNKTIKIDDFNEIEASQGIKVIYVQGSAKNIAEIATTPSAEKYLKVEVKNHTLKAYYSNTDDGRNVKIKGPSIIKVSSRDLYEVDLSSAAHLSIEGDLNVKGKFEIDLSSASSFNASTINCQNLDADLSSSASAYIDNIIGNLDADLSSASSFSVNSMSGNLDVEASSAASLKIDNIKTSVVSAEASSASTLTIGGISGGNIEASASSGAKIKLSGKAEYLKHNSSSGGSVNWSDLTVMKK